jgi:hypothetical protein
MINTFSLNDRQRLHKIQMAFHTNKKGATATKPGGASTADMYDADND